SSRWNSTVDIRVTEIPAGDYSVFVYIWEDNQSETYSLALQGQNVLTDLQSGTAGEWRRLGPFVVRVGKAAEIQLTTRGGDANISGIEIWQGVGPIPVPGVTHQRLPPQASAADVEHFRTKIAPLLATRCLECHNKSEPRGELDLSQWHKAFAGGESGAAIVPGKLGESLLWTHIESDEMPKGRPALAKADKELLRDWIKRGAAWGEPTIDPFTFSTARRAGYDWWSLQPIVKPSLPRKTPFPSGGNAIDAFVLKKLQAAALTPAPITDRRTLLRRVTFDLTGLPPTPAELQAFLNARDPQAYEKVVDRLLDSPHYGERWARHWLDVIRFGESQGYERNRIRDNAWRYRDWVIDAFNQNLPYDDFVRDQIAGDVLHPQDLNALIATGYHVCGTWDQVGHNEGSQEMRKAVRQDDLEDMVATLGQAFLGLTLNCARCHDHKFDPISQHDYYRFTALLSGITQKEKEPTGVKIAAPAKHLATRDFQGTLHLPTFQEPPTVFILARGDYRKPGEVVTPAGLSALDHNGLAGDFGLSPHAPEAERRRQLAKWLTDARNPLTARVFVNRVWYYHFGAGLVETPSDFGFNGGRPTHPELLDYLAANFIASKWDIKALHRLMVTSQTYRQASQVRSPAAEKVDAENRLLWRANRRRLEGEAVRDAVLSVSGALNPQLGGPSFRDVTVKLNQNHEFTGPTGEFTPDTCRRSVYRLWARSGNHPLLEGLDCPDPTVMVPRRARTITPLQALSLLNNRFMEQAAQRFA
ncbi:MAG TPA: PSD1 and planctomycete cytochrome C domain-containing protein, partial [Pirellulaceae bacterium]|nr:PSD1 and planctomycete cytochrome C domain-containing protein [Pirellulaceae bacterium]